MLLWSQKEALPLPDLQSPVVEVSIVGGHTGEVTVPSQGDIHSCLGVTGAASLSQQGLALSRHSRHPGLLVGHGRSTVPVADGYSLLSHDRAVQATPLYPPLLIM